jgi:hypothetical protein
MSLSTVPFGDITPCGFLWSRRSQNLALEGCTVLQGGCTDFCSHQQSGHTLCPYILFNTGFHPTPEFLLIKYVVILDGCFLDHRGGSLPYVFLFCGLSVSLYMNLARFSVGLVEFLSLSGCIFYDSSSSYFADILYSEPVLIYNSSFL